MARPVTPFGGSQFPMNPAAAATPWLSISDAVAKAAGEARYATAGEDARLYGKILSTGLQAYGASSGLDGGGAGGMAGMLKSAGGGSGGGGGGGGDFGDQAIGMLRNYNTAKSQNNITKTMLSDPYLAQNMLGLDDQQRQDQLKNFNSYVDQYGQMGAAQYSNQIIGAAMQGAQFKNQQATKSFYNAQEMAQQALLKGITSGGGGGGGAVPIDYGTSGGGYVPIPALPSNAPSESGSSLGGKGSVSGWYNVIPPSLDLMNVP